MDSIETAPTVLVVETGTQAGARLRLPSGTYRLGNDIAGDIVLSDTSLCALHAMVHCGAHGTTLQAVEGAIHIVDGPLLGPGEQVLCHRVTRLAAGGLMLRLEPVEASSVGVEPAASPAVTSRRLSRLAVVTGSLAAVSCVLIGITTVALDAASIDEAPRLPTPRSDPVRAPAVSLASVLSASRARLDVEGLRNISLSALSDGSIAARGDIGRRDQAAWQAAKRWFDAKLGASAVLVDDVTTADMPPPLAIQSVWAGSDPYVIDGSGQKLFEGAVLSSGWTIIGISAERVLIRRGPDTLAVRF